MCVWVDGVCVWVDGVCVGGCVWVDGVCGCVRWWREAGVIFRFLIRFKGKLIINIIPTSVHGSWNMVTSAIWLKKDRPVHDSDHGNTV